MINFESVASAIFSKKAIDGLALPDSTLAIADCLVPIFLALASISYEIS